MRAIVVYESMFGCTHQVAEAIADGLTDSAEVELVSVTEAGSSVVDGVQLLVVGGPTHIHGMSSTRSRAMAAEQAAKPDSGLELDSGAEGEGLRDWLHQLPNVNGLAAAAFDTRIGTVAPLLSGRASKTIARRLRHRGAQLVAPAESFLVNEDNALVDGELTRARDWGKSLLPA
jgi:flavodoxin